MCYLPMDVEALRVVLEEQPVSGKIVEEAITAQRFVQEYLYNVNPIIAVRSCSLSFGSG